MMNFLIIMKDGKLTRIPAQTLRDLAPLSTRA